MKLGASFHTLSFYTKSTRLCWKRIIENTSCIVGVTVSRLEGLFHITVVSIGGAGIAFGTQT